MEPSTSSDIWEAVCTTERWNASTPIFSARIVQTLISRAASPVSESNSSLNSRAATTGNPNAPMKARAVTTYRPRLALASRQK